MIGYIIGFMVTLFAIYVANVKLAKSDEKTNLGTAIIVSCLSWYGFILVIFMILLKALNEILEGTYFDKIFKGENK